MIYQIPVFVNGARGSAAFFFVVLKSIKLTDPEGRYDRVTAVAYAHKWSGGNYFTGRNLNFYNYSQNCANFVSQALSAGGIAMNNAWHSYRSMATTVEDGRTVITGYKFDVGRAWAKADVQFDFFSNPHNGYINGDVLSVSSTEDMNNAIKDGGVKPGDLLYFRAGDGEMHATMITKVANDEIHYSANTKSRNDEKLSKHFNAEKIFIIRIKDDAN
ncbi:MAG: hypothetical protein Ta2B_18160 [Termitinemataceae bacterium]|nr:MAG: hypothetical protein Ta2B_18160 [Termitinemataceae bacterium]